MSRFSLLKLLPGVISLVLVRMEFCRRLLPLFLQLLSEIPCANCRRRVEAERRQRLSHVNAQRKPSRALDGLVSRRLR